MPGVRDSFQHDANRRFPSLLAYLRELMRDIRSGWDAFWFTPADPVNLGVIRIIIGAVLLYAHLTTLPDLFDHIGPGAWVDGPALLALHGLPFDASNSDAGLLRSSVQSLWFHVQSPWLIGILHTVFIVALVCFTIGMRSRVASMLVWFGHISYVQRGTVIAFGMDSIVAMLTFYLMFAPVGATLSLDAWLRARGIGVNGCASQSVAANFVLRLIQVHLCLIYLFSGLSKVHGGSWWSGTAVYHALMIPEATLIDMGWIARRDWLWQGISNLGGFAAVLLELSFPVLVWNARLRPLMVMSAALMQLGFGALLSLGCFQIAMFGALVSFFPPAFLRAVLGRERKDARVRSFTPTPDPP